MGLLKLVFLLVIAVGPAYVAFQLYEGLLSDHPVPVIKDEFWGPGSKPGVIPPGQEDETIKPFKVDFTSSAILDDLKKRIKTELDSGRFAAPLEGIGFQYGFNTNYMKKVLNHWLTQYDFVAREKYLNRYPHFKTKIGGLEIHFQHIKPTEAQKKKYKRTVPVIFLHGWPGSIVEYQKLIDYFVEPQGSDINFEIVIPSLPGYGFSQAAARVGMAPVRIANIFGRLMKRLGYNKYYTLGEDWGSMIASDMGILYPDRVKATHTECVSLHPRDQVVQGLAGLFMSAETLYPVQRARDRFSSMSNVLSFSLRESGYLHIQATKPDTVGIGLTQSPAGLAAYIMEKFSTWTNETYWDKEDGGLAHKYTMDELLDNVMVYWVSKSITSSMRLYSEAFNNWNTWRVPVTVPSACIASPEDVVVATQVGLNAKYANLKHFVASKEGGHFQSYEMPKLVAKEAVWFFNKIEFGQL